LLIGLALGSGRSILELAGTGFIRNGGSFQQLLTEATPTAPPLPKSCHANQYQGQMFYVKKSNEELLIKKDNKKCFRNL